MILEYELQGSQLLHKGLFDTNGFWVKFDTERCDLNEEVQSYKIYSHFSFTFEHKEEAVARDVFNGLCMALSGMDWRSVMGTGYIRKIN
jgi:hypothetical protein